MGTMGAAITERGAQNTEPGAMEITVTEAVERETRITEPGATEITVTEAVEPGTQITEPGAMEIAVTETVERGVQITEPGAMEIAVTEAVEPGIRSMERTVLEIMAASRGNHIIRTISHILADKIETVRIHMAVRDSMVDRASITARDNTVDSTTARTNMAVGSRRSTITSSLTMKSR